MLDEYHGVANAMGAIGVHARCYKDGFSRGRVWIGVDGQGNRLLTAETVVPSHIGVDLHPHRHA